MLFQDYKAKCVPVRLLVKPGVYTIVFNLQVISYKLSAIGLVALVNEGEAF